MTLVSIARAAASFLAVAAAAGAVASDAAAVTVTQRPFPEYRCGSSLCKPSPATSITADGASGILAAGVINGDVYAHVTSAPTVTITPGPTGATPVALMIGPDGNPWALQTGGAVQEETPSGVVTRYQLPTGQPTAFAAGFGSFWLGLVSGSVDLDRFAAGGELTAFTNPAMEPGVRAIVAGPAKSMWFTSGGSIGQITAEGNVVLHPGREGFGSGDPLEYAEPYGIAVGPDGALWFVESNGERIGRMMPSGELQQFVIPNHSPANAADFPQPHDIVAGPDGKMWFTDPGDNEVGSVTMAGEVTEYPIPATTQVVPDEIVSSGGELIFNETNAPAIGTIAPAGTPSQAPLSTPPPRSLVQASITGQLTSATVAARAAWAKDQSAFTLTLAPPEAGNIVVAWSTNVLTRHTGRKSTQSSVVVATGQDTFDLAEPKPLEVRLTTAGAKLMKRAARLQLTARATFSGYWAGPIEATELQSIALHHPRVGRRQRRGRRS